MKWPYKVRHRKNGPVLAKIYRPCEGRSSYRVVWRAGGQRMMKSFLRFTGKGGAKAFADAMASDLAKGTAVPTLTAAEARAALAIRDALESFRQETGRTITAIQAVTECLGAKRILRDIPLSEAANGYMGTVATIKRVDLSVAVAEFVAEREAKTKAPEGKRVQLSCSYTYNTGLWLGWLVKMFPGTAVCDLLREQLDLFMAERSHLATKSKNHLRSTLKLFFAWCVRKDYLPKTHRLLEATAMMRETPTDGETDFYRHAEFKAMLEAADDSMRPIIALQGLAGIRLQECQRLTWEDVFRTRGHIAITATKSKNRSRRLVEMKPSLAAWLRPYRQKSGPLWSGHRDTWHARFTELREGIRLHGGKKVPSRKNGLRHSYCSHHFARYGNENLTAAQAGNSPGQIHKAYKALVTKQQGKAWFAIRPPKAVRNVVELDAHEKAAA